MEVKNIAKRLVIVSFVSLAILFMVSFISDKMPFFSHGECINIEYEEIEVTIIDKYHHGSRIYPVSTGKTISYVTKRAEWNVTVEYDEKVYVVDGKDAYERYGDKKGQNVIGVLRINTYEDGAIEKEIVSLK